MKLATGIRWKIACTQVFWRKSLTNVLAFHISTHRTGVNFIKILCARFFYVSFSSHVLALAKGFGKKSTFDKKHLLKMLVKLTTGVSMSPINFLLQQKEKELVISYKRS